MELSEVLRSGTGQHLESLEKQAQSLLQKQESLQQKQRRKQVLLNQLSQARTQLKAMKLMKASSNRCRTVSERIITRSTSIGRVESCRSDQTSSSNALLKLKSLWYRLQGISVCKLPQQEPHEPPLYMLRIDTAVDNAYTDRFYVVLQRKLENGTFSVFKHTVPHFLGLDDIAEQLLSHNPSEFAFVALQRCNAFVRRRQNLNEVERRLNELGEGPAAMASTAAIDLVHFQSCLGDADDRRVLDVRLVYTNLDWSVPTQALVRRRSPEETASWSRLRDAEQSFKKFDMPIALQKLIDIHLQIST